LTQICFSRAPRPVRILTPRGPAAYDASPFGGA
jgi:hypothetical protein